MINRLFLTFAAIATNLVLAYAHLRVYADSLNGKVETLPRGMAHIQSSEQVLTPGLTLSFGIAFLVLTVLAIFFAWKGHHKSVFLALVTCLLLIWIRLWTGAA
jgi:hypothetical protein